MSDNFTLYPLFSRPVFSFQAPPIEDENFNSLINISDENLKKDFIKNALCYTSKNKSILLNKKYEHIRKYIFEAFKKYIKVLNIKNINFYIKTSWITLTNPSESAGRHSHANSFISGVYYIDVDQLTGNIIFHNDTGRPSAFPASPFSFDGADFENLYQPINGSLYKFQPKKNQILLFPSDLCHSITVNQSTKKRISLAFDIFPYGFIKGADESLDLNLKVEGVNEELIIKYK